MKSGYNSLERRLRVAMWSSVVCVIGRIVHLGVVGRSVPHDEKGKVHESRCFDEVTKRRSFDISRY